MKARILVIVALLFCFGCGSQETTQLSQQEKDQIKAEAKAAVDDIVAKLNDLDAEGALQHYSPELVHVADGSQNDYQTYKKGWIDVNNSAASWKLVPVHEEIMVLTKDFAITTWVGKMEYVAKSGNKTTTDPIAYTDVSKKIESQWKVIYEHASMGGEVTEKAGKT
jgi:ketosteroid isomerase-like protein